MSTRFENGVLFVPTGVTETRIRWKPEPIAEERTVRGTWEQVWPEFRIVSPTLCAGSGDEKLTAFLAFREQIAPEFLAVVELFPSHQWALLKLLKEHEPLRDLAASSPVLAYCLASSYEFRRTLPEAAAVQAVWYSRRKQRVILDFLGFPPRESMVRLIRKITPDAAEPSSMRMLRSALTENPEVLRALGHIPRIHPGIVALLCNAHVAPLVGPRLLAEAAAADVADCIQIADILHDVTRMRRDLNSGVRISPVQSSAAARRLHARTLESYQTTLRQQAARRARVATALGGRPWLPQPDLAFPPPPVPGTDAFVPITTYADLVAEGKIQHNCVASYARRIVSERAYVYRVLEPQRATLSLCIGPGGDWRCGQLKAARNRRPSPHTVKAVDTWLQSHAQGLM